MDPRQPHANGTGSRHDQTLTVPARPSLHAAPPAPRHCMHVVAGATSEHTAEVNALLRRRLRIAVGIGLTGIGLFLFKGLVHTSNFGPSNVDLTIQAVLVALQVMLCALLWTSIPLCTVRLRAIELLSFGSVAAFFAYVQFRAYHYGAFLESIPPEHKERVLTLGNASNALRWFILIVLYGTFIPNTWHRCAKVVGALALTPIVLSFAVCVPCAVMGGYAWPILFDQTVILSLGAAIAIFGSYKLGELQEEAYQARKLGQYQLVRKLGAGGMGEVYLGEHMLLRRACAIKLIRPDQAGDPTTLHRFEREVQAMATLTHWNTVEVYDYGHTPDGTFYYVMEYLPGLSLQDLVERAGPLPPGRAIHFLRQLCAALREAHSIGLIHRDIKPSNIIVGQRGGVQDVAKLLDFGLVQDMCFNAEHADERLTMQGTVLGSPPYISPEQARGKTAVDPRTDIYSLGGLAYFLLTGRAPFVRETVMELMVAHLREPVTPPRDLRPEVPADLEAVVLTCLNKNPDDRFPDAEALDHALAACDAAGDWDDRRAAGWWREQELADVAKCVHVDGECSASTDEVASGTTG